MHVDYAILFSGSAVRSNQPTTVCRLSTRPPVNRTLLSAAEIQQTIPPYPRPHPHPHSRPHPHLYSRTHLNTTTLLLYLHVLAAPTQIGCSLTPSTLSTSYIFALPCVTTVFVGAN